MPKVPQAAVEALGTTTRILAAIDAPPVGSNSDDLWIKYLNSWNQRHVEDPIKMAVIWRDMEGVINKLDIHALRNREH